jgi:hypothetical protein
MTASIDRRSALMSGDNLLREPRCLKIIPNAVGERPDLKLMFSVLIRAANGGAPLKSLSLNVGR